MHGLHFALHRIPRDERADEELAEAVQRLLQCIHIHIEVVVCVLSKREPLLVRLRGIIPRVLLSLGKRLEGPLAQHSCNEQLMELAQSPMSVKACMRAGACGLRARL